jgi:hypothetical protein
MTNLHCTLGAETSGPYETTANTTPPIHGAKGRGNRQHGTAYQRFSVHIQRKLPTVAIPYRTSPWFEIRILQGSAHLPGRHIEPCGHIEWPFVGRVL